LNRNPIVISKSEDVLHLHENCKILLLRQDRIGDVLISVPTIRALRNRFPKAKIDLVLSRKNHGVSKAISKYVDKIWIYDKEIISIFRLVGNLRKESYDLVIDMLTSPSVTSSYLIKKIECVTTIGFDKENRDSYGYVIDASNQNQMHIVERTSELLYAFRVKPSSLDLSLEYHISDEEKRNVENFLGVKTKKRIGVNLSGSSKAKNWGQNNYIEFIKMITERYDDIEVFIFTTLIYKPLAKKILKVTGVKLAKVTNSIHEYACQLSTCDVLLTPDTSAVHFAAAFGIPCIALYNKRKSDDAANIWTSFGSPCVPLITTSGILSDISVEEVIQAFEELRKK
jgi:ADP-heptose:LPS heptosyltransferase